MIRHLTLKDVGPARDLKLAFSPRLNVLTGDNGLGKTFVLDVLWWALTNTWASAKALPWRPPSSVDEPLTPEITAVSSRRFQSLDEEVWVESGATFNWRTQDWLQKLWIPRIGPDGPTDDRRLHAIELRKTELVIYSRIDGMFAIWDPALSSMSLDSGPEAATILTAGQVWDGKDVPDAANDRGRRTVIRGLIDDWVLWQTRSDSREFAALQAVLAVLSPPEEPFVIGEPARVFLEDRRDIPTLDTSYGNTPVTLASAGIRRALSLAYVLVWAWSEHLRVCAQTRREPTGELAIIIDEPELHQHPAWQRSFLPAILEAVRTIAPDAGAQVFTATHSPLVLASLERSWNEESDDLFVLERDGRLVKAVELPFTKEGDVSSWLSSTVFGHMGGRSKEGELAIAAAMDVMAGRIEDANKRLAELANFFGEQSPGLADPRVLAIEGIRGNRPRAPLVERVHGALMATLPDHDRFWARWVKTWDQHPGGKVTS